MLLKSVVEKFLQIGPIMFNDFLPSVILNITIITRYNFLVIYVYNYIHKYIIDQQKDFFF